MAKPGDEEIRENADLLAGWVERDVMLHIPLNARVEREEDCAWVECLMQVPLPLRMPEER